MSCWGWGEIKGGRERTVNHTGGCQGQFAHAAERLVRLAAGVSPQTMNATIAEAAKR